MISLMSHALLNITEQTNEYMEEALLRSKYF